MLFGASLLLSVLPLLILLSSLANRRIDTALSDHIGLNGRGAHIVERLFRAAPAHSAGPIVIGVIVALLGSLTVVAALQVIYERVFEQAHRGWRDTPRFVAWLAVLLGALYLEVVIGKAAGSAAGSVVEGVLGFAGVAIFFAWTIHFLLAGRLAWRRVVRPAVTTAIFWLGLSLFSSAYFSSAVVSDTRLYGTIGVVFSLLTWFIAIGAVIVLGAASGAVWEQRRVTRPRGRLTPLG